MGIPIPKDDDLAPPRDRGRVLRHLLVGSAFLALTAATWPGLERALLFGDEHHSIRRLARPFAELFRDYDRYGSGLLLPLLQKLGCVLWGAGHWAYRWPAWLGGILGLTLAWLLARRLLGRNAAPLVPLALALSPVWVFYGQYARAYSLATALDLALLLGLLCYLERPGPGRALALVPWIALVPFAHLFAATSSVPAMACAAVLVWRRGPRVARPLWAALVLGGITAVALHFPARSSLRAFAEAKSFSTLEGSFGLLDVLGLLHGGRIGAWIALVGVPFGALTLGRTRPAATALLAAATLGPALALWLVRPAGLTYAWARYLLPTLPLQLAFLAAAVLWLVRRVPRCSEPVPVVLGGLLIGVGALAGPLGDDPARGGPFALSNLALRPLPAFDAPWPRRSRFYGLLADTPPEIRIVEAPELWNRSGLLYRNAWLGHRRDVLLGYAWEEDPSRIPAGPYVDLHDTARLLDSGARFLLFHRDVHRELENYWDFVFHEAWPKGSSASLRALMDAHSQVGFVRDRTARLRSMEDHLRKALGPPFWEDPQLVVWELARP